MLGRHIFHRIANASVCPATIAYEGVAVHGSSSSDVWVLGTDYTSTPSGGFFVSSLAIANWTGSGYTRHDTTARRFAQYPNDIFVADSTHVWMLSGYEVKFWDGSSWTTVLTHPLIGTNHGNFKLFVGTGANDLYAIFDDSGTSVSYNVGYYYWDGSTWTGPTGTPFGSYASLNAYAATYPSSTMLRVVGYSGSDNFQSGNARIRQLYSSVVDEYVGGAGTELYGIYCDSATTGIAVGGQNRSYLSNTSDPFILQLISGTWTPITPPTYSVPTLYYSVSGTSMTDVWIAVVQFASGDVFTTTGLHMLHYDGSTFTAYPLPGFTDAGLYGWLDRIWAVSSTDVWVVGTVGCGTYDLHSYTARWNGTSWVQVPIT